MKTHSKQTMLPHTRQGQFLLFKSHATSNCTKKKKKKKKKKKISMPSYPPFELSADTEIRCLVWFGWLFGFLTSSSTTRLYRGRAQRQSVWQFYVLPHMRQSWETMASVSAGHIILTPTQPVGSGRSQRESNLGSPHQESSALPTELPRN